MTDSLNNSASNKEYIASVNTLLHKYLKAEPDEAQRMPVLIKQLHESDCQLTSRYNMIGHLTASALVMDSSSNLLLIYHKGLKRWLQPGGHLDHNEEPETGARRELLEETGLGAVTLVHSQHSSDTEILPFDVDTHEIPANPGKGEGEHLHHDFQYIYKFSGDQAEDVILQEDEVDKFKWVSLDELATGNYGRRLSRVSSKLREFSNLLKSPRA